jgi:5-methylcytosine-specific restriction endonuclease McrA
LRYWLYHYFCVYLVYYYIYYQKKLKKIDRQEIYDKCSGHCAYCGVEITIKQMQVDHIKPLYRNDNVTTLEVWGVERGTDDVDNLNPSCARCNKWKSTYSLETFREIVQTSINRLERDTPNFRLARDYGLLKVTPDPVIFFFERK